MLPSYSISRKRIQDVEDGDYPITYFNHYGFHISRTYRTNRYLIENSIVFCFNVNVLIFLFFFISLILIIYFSSNISNRRWYQIPNNFIKKYCWTTNHSSVLFKWRHRSSGPHSLQNVWEIWRRMQLPWKIEKRLLFQRWCYRLPEWTWWYDGDSIDDESQRWYLLSSWLLWKGQSSSDPRCTKK